MPDTLTTFANFIEDDNASEMYISGMAGTGKTTSLGDLIDFCIEEEIKTVTCAYTHKAVGVLAAKIQNDTKHNTISTLHSFLRKCPTINGKAIKVAEVEGNAQVGKPETVDIVFIDEYSMIGEDDYNNIKELIDREVKFVYLGDKNQLPPVKDDQVIYPNGLYQVELTKVYRQKTDNHLLDTLIELNSYINGAKPRALQPHDNFIRGQNIVEKYKDFDRKKCLLAYTNRTVQDLNAKVQGYHIPKINDKLFSPTFRKHFVLLDKPERPNYIMNARFGMLDITDRYRTLYTLFDMECVEFFTMLGVKKETEHSYAVVFGHDNFLQESKKLASDAVKVNRKIEKLYKENAVDWAKRNYHDPLAKERANAWKRFLAFKQNVICVDFPHAMTIHKSQGSTYERVYLDMDDIALCAQRDYNLYLRLLYVAISRASDMVITN